MAVIDGFSAARMLEIEQSAVVGGLIDTYGRLILSRQDGTTFDAGRVVDVGTPSPTVNTIVARDGYARFQASDPIAPQDVDTKAARDAAILAHSAIATIGSGVNLDTYHTTGNFSQTSDAFAASGTNYPEAHAGLLEVFAVDATWVWQRYTVYRAFNATYWRNLYSGTWGPWQKVATSNAASLTSGTISDGRLPNRLQSVYNLGSGNDPDTLTENGFYSGYGWVGGLAGNGIGTLLVEKYSPDWIGQTYTTIEAVPRKYFRSRHSGSTWTAWLQVATTSMLSASIAAEVAARNAAIAAAKAPLAQDYLTPSSPPSNFPFGYSTLLHNPHASAPNAGVYGGLTTVRPYMGDSGSSFQLWNSYQTTGSNSGLYFRQCFYNTDSWTAWQKLILTSDLNDAVAARVCRVTKAADQWTSGVAGAPDYMHWSTDTMASGMFDGDTAIYPSRNGKWKVTFKARGAASSAAIFGQVRLMGANNSPSEDLNQNAVAGPYITVTDTFNVTNAGSAYFQAFIFSLAASHQIYATNCLFIAEYLGP